MTLRNTLIIVAVLSAMCLVAGGAFAVPVGAFVDNVQVTNNGTAVFSDDFNSGKLDNWKDVVFAEAVAIDPAGKDFVLNLNKKGTQKAAVVRDLGMKVAGTVELKAKVKVTGPEVQGNYGVVVPNYLEFWLAGSDPGALVRTCVVLNPKATSNRVGIIVQGSDKNRPLGVGAGPKKPVLAPNVWATLTLRMDRDAKTIKLLMDDKELASTPYNPDAFKEIPTLSIICTYGEGRDPAKVLIPGR